MPSGGGRRNPRPSKCERQRASASASERQRAPAPASVSELLCSECVSVYAYVCMCVCVWGGGCCMCGLAHACVGWRMACVGWRMACVSHTRMCEFGYEQKGNVVSKQGPNKETSRNPHNLLLHPPLPSLSTLNLPVYPSNPSINRNLLHFFLNLPNRKALNARKIITHLYNTHTQWASTSGIRAASLW